MLLQRNFLFTHTHKCPFFPFYKQRNKSPFQISPMWGFQVLRQSGLQLLSSRLIGQDPSNQSMFIQQRSSVCFPLSCKSPSLSSEVYLSYSANFWDANWPFSIIVTAYLAHLLFIQNSYRYLMFSDGIERLGWSVMRAHYLTIHRSQQLITVNVNLTRNVLQFVRT